MIADIYKYIYIKATADMYKYIYIKMIAGINKYIYILQNILKHSILDNSPFRHLEFLKNIMI